MYRSLFSCLYFFLNIYIYEKKKRQRKDLQVIHDKRKRLNIKKNEIFKDKCCFLFFCWRIVILFVRKKKEKERENVFEKREKKRK